MNLPICQGPDPKPKTPKFNLPSKACDTHAHIFGPVLKFPYEKNRAYTPPEALLPAYKTVLETLGIERGVIVHASMLGVDNASTLDVLSQLGDNFRGIAVIHPDIKRKDLSSLTEKGMRGARVSTYVTGGSQAKELEKLSNLIADFGWITEIHLGNVNELIELAPVLRKLPTPYLIDHLGRVKGSQGKNCLGFQTLLCLMSDDPNCWVKLSSFYRLSSSGPPNYEDMMPMALALISICPERIVWGTNWPHPIFDGPMPNDGDLLDLIYEWIPDQTNRKKIFIDNPSKLFGFD